MDREISGVRYGSLNVGDGNYGIRELGMDRTGEVYAVHRGRWRIAIARDVEELENLLSKLKNTLTYQSWYKENRRSAVLDKGDEPISSATRNSAKDQRVGATRRKKWPV